VQAEYSELLSKLANRKAACFSDLNTPLFSNLARLKQLAKILSILSPTCQVSLQITALAAISALIITKQMKKPSFLAWL
jgi:ABC-type phosphate/phosphonate transport system permease subunit